MVWGVLVVCISTLVLMCEAGPKPDAVDQLAEQFTNDESRYDSYSPDGVITVHHNIFIKRVVDLDIDKQVLSIDALERMKWRNENFEKMFKKLGLTTKHVFVSSRSVWLPDILCYNGAGKQNRLPETKLEVFSDGSVMYMPIQANIRSYCPVNLHIEAGEHVTCTLVFGSWLHPETELNIVTDSDIPMDAEYTDFNRNWELVRANATRVLKKYECCPGMDFATIKYELELKRKNHIN